MIVRLKEYDADMPKEITRFQFYDSPIKSRQRCNILTSNIGFNSMIVRLKGLEGVHSHLLNLCFNSMIVRLKEIAHS